MSQHDDQRLELMLEEEARRRAEYVRAEEESDRVADESEAEVSPDEAAAQVHRSGRQHDHSDTVGSARARRPRPRGPGR